MVTEKKTAVLGQMVGSAEECCYEWAGKSIFRKGGKHKGPARLRTRSGWMVLLSKSVRSIGVPRVVTSISG